MNCYRYFSDCFLFFFFLSEAFFFFFGRNYYSHNTHEPNACKGFSKEPLGQVPVAAPLGPFLHYPCPSQFGIHFRMAREKFES